MDADASATSSVFNYYEDLTAEILRDTYAPIDPVQIKKMTRTGYLLGIYIAHIFLDTLSRNLLPKEHPFSYCRFLTSIYVLRNLYTLRAQEAKTLVDETRLALVECFIKLSGHIKFLGHPLAANTEIYTDNDDEPQYVYDSIGEASCLNFIRPLEIKWSEIRPYLLPFKRGGELAPAVDYPIYDVPASNVLNS